MRAGPSPSRDHVGRFLPILSLRQCGLMCLGVFAGFAAWTGWALATALPMHPWLTVPAGGLVLAWAFFFAALHPISQQQNVRIWNISVYGVMACFAIAAFITPGKTPMPTWGTAALATIACVWATLHLATGIAGLWLATQPEHPPTHQVAEHQDEQRSA